LLCSVFFLKKKKKQKKQKRGTQKEKKEEIPESRGHKIVDIEFIKLSHGISNCEFDWTKVWTYSSMSTLSFHSLRKRDFKLITIIKRKRKKFLGKGKEKGKKEKEKRKRKKEKGKRKKEKGKRKKEKGKWKMENGNGNRNGKKQQRNKK